MVYSSSVKESWIIVDLCKLPPQTASMANSLYHSLQGQYFVGYADNIFFEPQKNAWATLYNPKNSNVILFVNVWTVTSLRQPIRMQIWINAKLPGQPTASTLVTPANTAICPPPKPEVRLMQVSNVADTPTNGVKAFVRRAPAGETVVAEEDGKFIIPPGGNFAVFLSNDEDTKDYASARVAYGWWEERIYPQC